MAVVGARKILGEGDGLDDIGNTQLVGVVADLGHQLLGGNGGDGVGHQHQGSEATSRRSCQRRGQLLLLALSWIAEMGMKVDEGWLQNHTVAVNKINGGVASLG